MQGPNELSVDIQRKPSPFSRKNQITRAVWAIVYFVAFRPSPRPMHGWRRSLLRLFGAKLGRGAKVFSTARIWAPWNLAMGDYSTIAPDVDCYSAGRITIGAHTTISQYSFLCAASHDHTHPNIPLFTAPISIGDQVWVCADVFVGPGVSIGDGTVVGARSSVFTDLPAWKVCMGSPARARSDRILQRDTNVNT